MTYMSNALRRFTSEMADAPTLSAVAGALIAVLDACLVTGFGARAVNALTVTGGIATAQISSGHPFAEGDVVRVAGATPAALIGDWRVANVTADTVTWSVAGLGISDGAATGTITALRAPAGWEKIYAGTNRAAYRSLEHATHNGLILYVDDTGTTTARVRGYASMTDIDTGLGAFPTDAQLAGGGYWAKAHNAIGSRTWSLTADAKRLLFCPRYASQTARSHGFGLLLDAAANDPWATLLSTAASAANAIAEFNAGSQYGDLVYNNSTLVAGYLARSAAGVASAPAYVANAALASTSSGNSNYLAGELPQDIPPLMHVMIGESGLAGRGFFPGPCYSNRRFSSTSYPGGTLVGAPGNGAQIEYAGAISQSQAWWIHLGADGRWD